MTPNIDEYKILSMDGLYYALTPYDLFAMPALKISSKGFQTKAEAQERIQFLFDLDLDDYERLRKIGRCFPDND